MNCNPILEDLYAAREKLLRDAGGDIHQYVQEARKRALASGRQLAVSGNGYNPDTSTETQDLIRICDALPEAKRAEVANFARFLLAQQSDERWEQIIASPKSRPKLDAFLKDSAREAAEHSERGRRNK